MFRDLANQSGFSIERLASLCEVAEAGSIGKASRGDPNRQSLLSRQIAELEGVFGVPLLARHSRPYRLTTEGSDLAIAARQFFQVAEDLQKRASGLAQRVVVGAGEMLIQWLLFPATEAIRRESNDVTFAFKNLDSVRLLEATINGEVDVALLRAEDTPASLSKTLPLSYQQTVFAARKLSRATGTLEVKELASLPWAVLEGRGHFRTFLEDKAQQAGCKLNAALECSSYTQVAMAVETGHYAGFLPDFAAATFAGKPTILQRSVAPELRYQRSLVLAWKESTVRSRPLTAEIIQSLHEKVVTTLAKPNPQRKPKVG
ncbi:MAG: LysR family transcriptional regulator [Verrucomicrobiales bacterium]|nr:LysR family transcriptional regulator [Verrucomicrobiales bacterium]